MATSQLTLLSTETATNPPDPMLINIYCSRGYNVNHSCRQCLQRTLECWGYDAAAYDREAIRETAKARSKAHRKHSSLKGDRAIAHASRQRKYGITPQEFKVMLEEQKGVCALCYKPETKQIKGTFCPLSVDHDHKTGAVRGLLCNSCNTFLGHLEKKSPGWLKRAQAYLGMTIEPPQPKLVVVEITKKESPPDKTAAQNEINAMMRQTLLALSDAGIVGWMRKTHTEI